MFCFKNKFYFSHVFFGPMKVRFIYYSIVKAKNRNKQTIDYKILHFKIICLNKKSKYHFRWFKPFTIERWRCTHENYFAKNRNVCSDDSTSWDDWPYNRIFNSNSTHLLDKWVQTQEWGWIVLLGKIMSNYKSLMIFDQENLDDGVYQSIIS